MKHVWILLLLWGCSEDGIDLQDSGRADVGQQKDSGSTDGGDAGTAPDVGAPMDAGGPEDTGAPQDAGTDAGNAGDGGMTDAGTMPDAGLDCASLQRDVCIATVGCVLDGTENLDPGYFCRDAVAPCETIKDRTACDAEGLCAFDTGGCYCPEDEVCACGGGPAPVCRHICGGFAGIACPSSDFFCDYPPAMTGGPICQGNADDIGTCIPIPPSCMNVGNIPVCGCLQANATTYANDCERRAASASFGQLGACP